MGNRIYVVTEFKDAATKTSKTYGRLYALVPIGRVVGPEDVAALAVHVMSNTALTGATYDVDGGQQLVA